MSQGFRFLIEEPEPLTHYFIICFTDSYNS